MKGEIVLKRLKKGAWGIEYIDGDIAKRKAEEQHIKELRRTADYIQQITNDRPSWGWLPAKWLFKPFLNVPGDYYSGVQKGFP